MQSCWMFVPMWPVSRLELLLFLAVVAVCHTWLPVAVAVAVVRTGSPAGAKMSCMSAMARAS